MSFGATQLRRSLASMFRVPVLVLFVLVFGQINSVAHAHDAHDEHPVPVACDVCLSGMSDEEDDQHSEEDDTGFVELLVFTIPTTLRLSVAEPAPSAQRIKLFRHLFEGIAQKPHAARAPPA